MVTGPPAGSQGGWPCPGADAEVIRVLRPSDGSLVGELAVTPAHEIPRRVARTRSVQVGWASLPAKDRERRLRSLLDAIGGRTQEIEDTIVAETGKPRVEATIEVMTVVEHLRYHLKNASALFRPRKVSTGWRSRLSMTRGFRAA